MTASVTPAPEAAVRVHVHGLVQGVGFRPFVWRLATKHALQGWVSNDAVGVVLEVEGAQLSMRDFLAGLDKPPPLARVQRVEVEVRNPVGYVGFEVRLSDPTGPRTARVAADTATCTDCLRELLDPQNRRYRYPFINCTNCGPRFSIVESVPYDRARTTMRDFLMCARCRSEYNDPADRRFRAEPICCPDCGPRLSLRGVGGSDADPVKAAAALLEAGKILAVKGIGGFHLAVDATNEVAVRALRKRKHREERPFAVMVADVTEAGRLGQLSAAETSLLTDPSRPIVLLRRRHGAHVARSVAPGSDTLGILLAYTPVHTLLLEAFGGPLVMTSGNAASEPIAYADDDALERLSELADAFLLHDRRIHTHVDDSVTRVVADRLLPVRRSRGLCPDPIPLPLSSPHVVLAVGAALKSTFCLSRGGEAFVSQHLGDLDDYASLTSFVNGIEQMSGMLGVVPEVVAHDLHPEYPSTRYAQDRSGVELLPVQHHHAHIASCLADNGSAEPVIGVAFDGLGLGPDGTAWGGEVLVADLASYERFAHLAPVGQPGGDTATRQPWRMALAHLTAAFGAALPVGLAVTERQGQQWNQVRSLLGTSHAPLTSSAGRLFDGVAALLGVRDIITYEGQAAIELERCADERETGSYDVPITNGVVDVGALARALVADIQEGAPRPVLAARFHNALSDVVRDLCVLARDSHGLDTVALSGGVFQNALLLTRCLERLHGAGFAVLTHRRVPPNDGGISLGQAAVAAAVLRARG